MEGPFGSFRLISPLRNEFWVACLPLFLSEFDASAFCTHRFRGFLLGIGGLILEIPQNTA